MLHLSRPAVLGVDPRLVLRVDLGAPVSSDEFRRARLQVLDAADNTVVVAFADDPQMAAFLQRLDECARGALPGQTSEPYAAFVDAIAAVRALGPDDRITDALGETISRASPGVFPLWCSEDYAANRILLSNLALYSAGVR